MNVMLTSLGTVGCYLIGTIIQGLRISGYQQSRHRVLMVTVLGVIGQTVVLYQLIHTPQGINLGFFIVGALTTLMVILVVLLSSLSKPVDNLLALLLPIAMLSVLCAWLMPSERIVWQPSAAMIAHVLISVLAYGILMVAALQSLLLSFQEYQLRRHQQRIVSTWPSLQTMEKLLFELLGAGVLLLTFSLITGLLFLDGLFAQPTVHKTVLSITAWCLLVTLLIGHWQWGWRGHTAMRWTVAGFATLALAYFGWRLTVDWLGL